MSVVEDPKQQLLSGGTWFVDPAHSAIESRIRHLMIQTVTGRFHEFDGALVAGAEASVSGSIHVANLDTLDSERDAHLRSSDFFDVARHSEISITFDGEFYGAAVDLDGGERIAVALRGRLDRSDYGLVWNRALEAGNALLGGDIVDLLIDVAAVGVD
jgi:polyisoprenoid-binding protein YceI